METTAATYEGPQPISIHHGRRSGKRAITLGSAVNDPPHRRGRSGNPVEDITMFLAHLRLLGLFAFLALQGDTGGDDGGDEGGDTDGDDTGATGERESSQDDSDFRAPKDQAELDRMISRRLKSHADRAKAEAKTEFERERQATEAKDKDDVRALLKLAEDKIATLEGELKQERTGSLRTQVATAYKLPDDIAELLKGETKEELTEHAKRLAKHVASRADGGEDESDTSADDIDNDAGARGSKKRGNQKPIPQFRIASTVKTVKMPGA